MKKIMKQKQTLYLIFKIIKVLITTYKRINLVEIHLYEQNLIKKLKLSNIFHSTIYT